MKNVGPFLSLLASVLFFAPSAQAMFAMEQTQQVPIERVLTNLQARAAKEPKDFEATYHLARVHSMAYSTDLSVVKVTKTEGNPVFGHPGRDAGIPEKLYLSTNRQERAVAYRHLTNAIAYYEQALLLLKKSTNEHARWYTEPIHLGYAWCLDQAGRRDDAINAYRKALQVSWHIEVEGDYTFKEQLEYSWDRIRARENPFKKRDRYLGPGVCFSEEIIGYLLKLLDPKKDAKEIAQLKADQTELKSMGRAITPIVVPLEQNLTLEQMVDSSAGVTFDLDGTGQPRRWGWITPKSAWLVFDKNGSGKITSGLQMFGNVTFWVFWRNGYDALAALDDNGDGLLAGNELHGLSLWQDANSNGVSDAGEVKTVQSCGIKTLRCDSASDSSGMAFNPEGIVLEDGTTRPTYDWIAPSVK